MEKEKWSAAFFFAFSVFPIPYFLFRFINFDL
ncbi:MAG: hypothetical protein UX49_C0038G0014 [Candidatus Wolfebacteria bacterium GW2011_GWC2_46_275]|nr:MAG: hypothetical protein UX49_C0038G0014 [Candidatus Wolfebacteria bacterium GW2011_GWC2_46_275]